MVNIFQISYFSHLNREDKEEFQLRKQGADRSIQGKRLCTTLRVLIPIFLICRLGNLLNRRAGNKQKLPTDSIKAVLVMT